MAYIGEYPDTAVDSTYFYFTKTGSVASGTGEWFEIQPWFKQVSSAENSLPTEYALSQNYPNPFNTKTMINYQLPIACHVRLEIYNTLGQKVTTLVDEGQEAGYRSTTWDTSDVSSGLYFYKLSAGEFSETKRMMLVK